MDDLSLSGEERDAQENGAGSILSGQRVDVPYTPVQKQPSELILLAEFFAGEFQERCQQLEQLAEMVAADPDRRMLHELGGRAVAFRIILSHWEPRARRLYKELFAVQQEVERDVHKKTRTAEEIKNSADTDKAVAFAKEMMERISNVRDDLKETIWWAREQFRNIVAEEFSGEAAGASEFTEPVYPSFQFRFDD